MSGIDSKGTIVFQHEDYKEVVVSSNQKVGKQIVKCISTILTPSGVKEVVDLYRIEYFVQDKNPAFKRCKFWTCKVRYSLEEAKKFYKSI